MINREEIFRYIETKHDIFPDYPWLKMPNYAVLRHKHNQKWIGVIMDITKNKLGLNGNKIIDAINIKSDPIIIGSLIDNVEIFPAWHMNREHWITILMDSSISKQKVYDLIDLSYELTKK